MAWPYRALRGLAAGDVGLKKNRYAVGEIHRRRTSAVKSPGCFMGGCLAHLVPLAA
jgi:hypothetical protein